MLRLLSLNLQHGAIGAGAAQATDPTHRALAGKDIAEPRTAHAALQALAEQIAELAPDVVLLQEVDHHQKRSANLDQTSILAKLLGMPHHRFAAAWAGPVAGLRRRPLRSALAEAGDELLGPLRALVGLPPQGFGNALLSRFPVTTWRVQRLGRGAPSWTRSGPVWDPRGYRLWTASSRLMLTASIDLREATASASPASGEVGALGATAQRAASALTATSGQADMRTWADADLRAPEPQSPKPQNSASRPRLPEHLAVGVTHLATNTATARRQLADAWRGLSTLPGPHMLGGDMNLWEEEVAALGVARPVGTGDTYPAGIPDHRIDHFLTDPWPAGPNGLPDPTGQGVLRAVGWGTRSFVISDHAGTWVDLELSS
ncbi:Uncharacterized protein conserved in bacteria [Actinomyces bovis]|uniref:Uncharacterized protein conserved in bacteria n=1 Tax=Actinomyces bovis TaxID=1658 RepID=A0ABY1VN13_9ACTO|nr:endonuclease/exonuclease/phosphatase family protein [Actinomyces bovis]SPT53504.1 Uncharacterized protein conserved in bacteria [Actinomyces bovis]VEG55421.1 Uncharacterized protein conserved in bacteria [Actinomyces israelii]